MADDLVFQLGETRRLRHEVSGETGFSVSTVLADLYAADDTHVVTAGAGVANSLQADNARWEIYYLWTPAAAGDYRYSLRYTVGTQVYAVRGTALVWPAVSKLDRYISRLQGWLQESGLGEDQQQLSQRDYRDALAAAVDAYSQDNPRALSADVPLTAGQWEYPLSGLTSFEPLWSDLQAVEYPVGASPTRPYLSRQEYRLDRDRAVWALLVSPSAGQTARVHYTGEHTLSHATDTLPPGDFEPLCQYAAGVAMGGDVANLYARTSDPQRGAEVIGGYTSKSRDASAQGGGADEAGPGGPGEAGGRLAASDNAAAGAPRGDAELWAGEAGLAGTGAVVATFEISVSSPSLDRFRARLQALPETVRGALPQAVSRAGDLARKEVASRAPASFGPHIYARIESGGDEATARVGVDLNAKPHALYVDRGTGIYATLTARRPWTVRPVRAKALRFLAGGRVVFARYATIRGMRGRQFMRKGLQAARPAIQRSVRSSMAAVTRSLARGG